LETKDITLFKQSLAGNLGMEKLLETAEFQKWFNSVAEQLQFLLCNNLFPARQFIQRDREVQTILFPVPHSRLCFTRRKMSV
jgi:hypothetical protein